MSAASRHVVQHIHPGSPAGLFVVLAIFVSACIALYETILRLVLAATGIVGLIGNEIAAQVRLRAGRRLSSPAPTADPIIGLGSTAVILKVTRDSWRTVSTTDPGMMRRHP